MGFNLKYPSNMYISFINCILGTKKIYTFFCVNLQINLERLKRFILIYKINLIKCKIIDI